jgi:hypothetical protein
MEMTGIVSLAKIGKTGRMRPLSRNAKPLQSRVMLGGDSRRLFPTVTGFGPDLNGYL